MGIACDGCGRTYDAARFTNGRTLHCTCGARVGQRVVARASTGPPRFMVDAMLGGLARWLRVLGYDAAYEAGIPDGDLVRRAASEGRIALTRDRRLPEEWWIEDLVVLRSDEQLEQLREIAPVFSLTRDGLFTRCTRCNLSLAPMSLDEAADRVPPLVRERSAALQHCPSCDRIYWEGSHTERMRRTLDRVLG